MNKKTLTTMLGYEICDSATRFYAAARDQNGAECRRLLERGVPVDSVGLGCGHDTALAAAAANGDEQLVEILLEHHATVDQICSYGETPLFRAAGQGHAAVVALLMLEDASAETVNDNGISALMSAAFNGHTAVVLLLLENGATVEPTVHMYGWASLRGPAASGHAACVRALLAAMLPSGAAAEMRRHFA